MTTATATAITFHRSTLASALTSLARLATQKTLPILTGIRITAEEDRAVLEATDLDTRARLFLSCTGEGAAVLPAALLAELVSRLSSDSVTLEIEPGRVTVRGGRSVTKIAPMALEEWPEAPATTGDPVAVLPGETLKHLASCATFASREPTKPILNGVYFHPVDGRLAAVGTDGFRLIVRDSELPSTLDVILHGVGLTHALKFMEGATSVEIRQTGHFVEIASDAAAVQLRTVEGPYIGYRDIMPKQHDKLLVMDRRDLMASLRRMELIARQGMEEKNLPRVTFECSAEAVTLTAQRDHEMEEVLIPDSYAGEDFRISFNIRYLLDLLGEMSAPKVELQMGSPVRAVLMRAGDGEGIFLVMPLRNPD